MLAAVAGERHNRTVVQVVENRSLVTGTLRRVMPSDRGEQWRILVVEVASIDDVPGFANLLPRSERALQVSCRSAELAQAKARDGVRVRATVRLAAPGDVLVQPGGLSIP